MTIMNSPPICLSSPFKTPLKPTTGNVTAYFTQKNTRNPQKSRGKTP